VHYYFIFVNVSRQLVGNRWFDSESGLRGSALTFCENQTIHIEGVNVSGTGTWEIDEKSTGRYKIRPFLCYFKILRQGLSL